PTVADAGFRLLSVGTGFRIVRVCAFDVPPPGAALTTFTCGVPATAMSAAAIVTVNCVGETYVVVRAAPFHRTTEPDTKFVPVTVSASPEPPTAAVAGLSAVVVGTGLLGAVIVKVCGFDVPPPGAGLNTATCAVPTVARSVAAIAAVSRVPETKVVGPFAPFHRTTEPDTKFVPETVSVRPGWPAVTDAGLNPAVVGSGLVDIATFTVAPPVNPAIA